MSPPSDPTSRTPAGAVRPPSVDDNDASTDATFPQPAPEATKARAPRSEGVAGEQTRRALFQIKLQLATAYPLREIAIIEAEALRLRTTLLTCNKRLGEIASALAEGEGLSDSPKRREGVAAYDVHLAQLRSHAVDLRRLEDHVEEFDAWGAENVDSAETLSKLPEEMQRSLVSAIGLSARLTVALGDHLGRVSAIGKTVTRRAADIPQRPPVEEYRTTTLDEVARALDRLTDIVHSMNSQFAALSGNVLVVDAGLRAIVDAPFGEGVRQPHGSAVEDHGRAPAGSPGLPETRQSGANAWEVISRGGLPVPDESAMTSEINETTAPTIDSTFEAFLRSATVSDDIRVAARERFYGLHYDRLFPAPEEDDGDADEVERSGLTPTTTDDDIAAADELFRAFCARHPSNLARFRE